MFHEIHADDETYLRELKCGCTASFLQAIIGELRREQWDIVGPDEASARLRDGDPAIEDGQGWRQVGAPRLHNRRHGGAPAPRWKEGGGAEAQRPGSSRAAATIAPAGRLGSHSSREPLRFLSPPPCMPRPNAAGPARMERFINLGLSNLAIPS
jgi:hypothetical protein